MLELLRSSVFRLAFMAALAFSLAALAVGAFLYLTTVTFANQQIDTTIAAEITGLAEHYEVAGLPGLVKTLEQRLEQQKTSAALYLLVDRHQRLVIGNVDGWPRGQMDAKGWLRFRLAERYDYGGRVVSVPARGRVFRLQGGYHLLVGRDLTDVELVQQRFVQALSWGAVGLLLIALVLAWSLSRMVQRRLAAINQAADEIMCGDLSRRIPDRGSYDEFDQLTMQLNAMLDRIQQAVDDLKRVSDNIAHDLRTPLSHLRNQLEALQAAEPQPEQSARISSALKSADGLLATFSALLRIARIESQQQRQGFAQVDVAELVHDAAELYELVAEGRQQTLSCEIDAAVTLEADRDLLFQAIANLLDNACKYAPEHAHIRLQLQQQEYECLIIISDNGPGIPEDQLAKVSRRFYRLEQSRSTAGNGLGLSLVEAVMGLHQGRLLLSNDGPGLSASLCLPVDIT